MTFCSLVITIIIIMHHHQGRKERYDKHILREKKVICIYTHKEATKVWITVMKKIYITANKLLLVHTNTHTHLVGYATATPKNMLVYCIHSCKLSYSIVKKHWWMQFISRNFIYRFILYPVLIHRLLKFFLMKCYLIVE